jgi:hypothetical protein
MSTLNPEEMIVVTAIRRSFETISIPGNSVNFGPNPFTPGLAGTFDLLQAARAVLRDLDQHRERLAEQAKKKAEAEAASVEPFAGP